MGRVALTHRNCTVKRALKAPLSAFRDAFSNPTQDTWELIRTG